MFDRKSALFRAARAIRRRYKAITLGQLFFDLLSHVSTACVILVSAALTVQKEPWLGLDLATLKKLPPWVFLYASAVLYPPIHRAILVGRFKNRRLMSVERERPIILSAAITQIKDLLNPELTENGRTTAAREAQRKILNAIVGEIESLVADSDGVYVEASLIVQHRSQEDRLQCIQRAKGHRDVPKDYRKAGMLAWRAMEELLRVHEPDFEGTKYRSILCFPLYVRPNGQDLDNVTVLGAVSIDHGIAFEFDGLEDQIEERISPYLRLLEHLLLLEQSSPHGPPRSQPAKPPRRRK